MKQQIVKNHKSKKHYDELVRKGTALKAIRLKGGFSRKLAAQLCGCSDRSFEQIENARVHFSDERLKALVETLGCHWSEFQNVLKDPALALRSVLETDVKTTITQKPRRNTFKKITKEVRVLKVLRERKRISQCEASKLCGYSRCTFGQIEHGRIELSPMRITEILRALAIPHSDFEYLMRADTIKDELITECVNQLKQLDEDKLASIHLIVKSFNQGKRV